MKSKKDLLGGLIIIVLLILVLVTYMSFYNYKNKLDNKPIKDNSLNSINIYGDFSFEKIEDKNSIDTDKIVIGTYNCKNDDCEVYTNTFDNIYDNKYVLIKENNKVFVYDFTTSEIVSNLYDDINSKLNDYFIVKTNKKYGIIVKSGLELVKCNYDEILSDNSYNSYIKVKNNNLYGVLDLDNGQIVVDTKYDDVFITDSKYFSILKDGLWYVIDSNENIVTSGYSYIFAFSKGFIALDNNSLQFLKYNKENKEYLNTNSILVSSKNDYKIERNNNIITIDIASSNLKYEYNISRNNLLNK